MHPPFTKPEPIVFSCVRVYMSDQPFGDKSGVGEGINSEHLHTYAGGQCWFSSSLGEESKKDTY